MVVAATGVDQFLRLVVGMTQTLFLSLGSLSKLLHLVSAETCTKEWVCCGSMQSLQDSLGSLGSLEVQENTAWSHGQTSWWFVNGYESNDSCRSKPHPLPHPTGTQPIS